MIIPQLLMQHCVSEKKIRACLHGQTWLKILKSNRSENQLEMLCDLKINASQNTQACCQLLYHWLSTLLP